MGDVIIVMGVSGSGKTTIGSALAKAAGGAFFEGDSYHSLANVEKMRAGIPLTDDDRQGWLETLRDLIAAEGRKPGIMVLACSALKESYRRILCEKAEGVRFVFLTGPEALLRERMEARAGHYMPAGLLASQLETLEAPAGALTVDISDPGAILIPNLLARLNLQRSSG